MINIVSLFMSFCEYAMDYECGPDPMPEWNRKVNEVQDELMDMIAPLYDINERVRTLIRPMIKKHTDNAVVNGFVPNPEDLYRIVGTVNVENGESPFSLHYISENGVIINNRIPQRDPSLIKKIGYYHPSEGGNNIYPATLTDCNYYYIKVPTPGKLTYEFIAADANSEMLLEVKESETVDLEWEQNAFNLFLYKLLEKYGISNGDALKVEYSRLGISESLTKSV